MTRFMSRAWRLTFSVVCLACASPTLPARAWMNPTRDRIAEANTLFKQGKYDEAIAQYGNALVDHPESPLLNFNMGDANYKTGKYSEAIASFARVRPGDPDSTRAAKAAYNIGNAEYRLAAAAEAEKPQEALKGYAAALVAYRRALGADPTDQDSKFNYEFVTKKIDDLKKKLEEQQKQQEQKKDQQKEQQDEQKQDQQKQDEQKQDEQKQDQQQQGDQQQKDQPQQDQQQKDEQQQEAQDKDKQQAQQDKDAQQPQQDAQQEQAQPQNPADKNDQEQNPAAAAGAGGGDKQEKMSKQEAAALIDTAKNDELRPDEFARQVQGGRVVEPAQDW